MVSDAFARCNTFYAHAYCNASETDIYPRQLFSIYKLTRIVEYFPPRLLDELMSCMKGPLWKFTKSSGFLVTIRVNY